MKTTPGTWAVQQLHGSRRLDQQAVGLSGSPVPVLQTAAGVRFRPERQRYCSANRRCLLSASARKTSADRSRRQDRPCSPGLCGRAAARSEPHWHYRPGPGTPPDCWRDLYAHLATGHSQGRLTCYSAAGISPVLLTRWKRKDAGAGHRRRGWDLKSNG